MKVYAVYSIPKSPEYRLEKLFLSNDGAKDYIKIQKRHSSSANLHPDFHPIYDIQIEEIEE
jgi:hypothetical protein